MSGKKMGRPPLEEGKAKALVFTLRLSSAERAEIEQAAQRAGVPVTQWARSILLASARSS